MGCEFTPQALSADKAVVVDLVTGKTTPVTTPSNHNIDSLRDNDVIDEHGRKLATMSDIKKTIDAMGGTSVAALWLFFAR